MDNELLCDVRAEDATLGSVILNRDALIAIVSWLRPDDFSRQSHAWIYEAMVQCYQRKIPPDVQLVGHMLGAERLALIGGIDALASLINTVPSSYHVEHYARIVQRYAVRRRMRDVGQQITQLALDAPDDDPQTLQADVQALVSGLTIQSRDDLVWVGDVADRVFDDFTRGTSSGVPTGLRDYDELTGGMHPGQLIVIAGRPGHGKSSLANTIARNIAVGIHGRKYTTAVFSLEMINEEWVQRLYAMESGVDVLDIRRHSLDEQQLQRLARAKAAIKQRPIYLRDTPRVTAADMRASVLRFQAEHNALDLVVVDYLGLVHAPQAKNDNRAFAVGQVTKALKELAKELKVPIILLVQQNREMDKRAGLEPQLADLRESGDIEADADIVGFIVRPVLYDDKTDEPNVAKLYVRKQRGGPTGIVPLWFDAATTQFKTLTYREYDS